MSNINYTLLVVVAFLLSCSEDDDGMGSGFAEQIMGGWQLEMIKVAGADCTIIFGDDVPEMYIADEVGCASPDEILGNAKRCINVEFRANGEGTFFWSEISGQQDAPITYSITNNEIEYCFVNSACSNSYKLVGSRLESELQLRFDQECSAIYVLRPK